MVIFSGLENFILTKMWRVYKTILDLLRESNMITYMIFGIKIRKAKLKIKWDVTTLVLKKAIDKYIKKKRKKVLEMGCGQVAILSQYVKKNNPSDDVYGVDFYDQFVQNARLNARRNKIPLTIEQSDMFKNVHTKFDFIFFNPPYVPEKKGEKEKMVYDKTHFSGFDGTYATKKFLSQSKKHINKEGKILLGINCFYIPKNKMIKIIKSYKYDIENILSSRLNTSKVFVLRSK